MIFYPITVVLLTLFPAILLLDLQLPAYVKLGDSAKLVCVYDLEFDGFYRFAFSNFTDRHN